MTLTVYAFSVDNWRRPAAEVAALMTMMGTYLETDLARLVGAGIRLRVIGRRDRLPDHLVPLICHAEMVTAPGRTLDLRVAIDYSGRDSILAAAAACASEPLSRDAISRALANGAGAPDVDLLIRTSGEKRLSDFLLWEAAYAELHFTDRLWPDFTAEDLELALRDFRSRNRRFGGLTAERPATAAELPTPVAPPRRAFAARALAAFFGTL